MSLNNPISIRDISITREHVDATKLYACSFFSQVDQNESNTIWRQVSGIDSLQEVALLGFKQPMAI
jgi:hypothetical protein